MNLLAIETATEACSAAVLTDAGIVERFEIAPRRHAELLLPMCEAVLAEAGIARRQLDAIAVGRGPGAFTGVRLAIAAAQGIALALDVPVITISSLAALALQAPDVGQDATLAVIDARMGEVYAGAFRPTPEGGLAPLGAESVGPASALIVPEATRWAVVGTGWLAFPDVLRTHLPGEPLFAAGERYPQAGAVARLAAPLARAGQGVAAELALPVYLRDKVALTLEEQRRGR